ncbi:YcjF family protein [Imhoffiella purpurea]|uniref:GTPase n=1 Tax=Imhoffiella purpurea TaxID=1249627 RepID=W9VT17_9GAMM|nr:DUF697 domain-containing protein [Imhoffiella purpurea]EXJ13520.1 Putative protein/domain associated with GTPase [Imhoffiella purpurea]
MTEANEAIQEQGPEVDAAETEDLSTLERSNRLIRQFVLWSAGGGLIPVPLLDISAIYAAQVTMIAKMTKIYGIPFSEHTFKNLLWPLFGSLGLVPVTTGLVASVMKVVPGIGHLLSSLSMPVMAGAITYATGKIFATHFEAGGTLLDFDPEQMKDHYKALFEEGKHEARQAAETKA